MTIRTTLRTVVSTSLVLMLSIGCKGTTTDSTDSANGTGTTDSTDTSDDTAVEETDTAPQSTPTVLSNSPLDGAVDAALNKSASVEFSEAMDPATFEGGTFTLTTGEPPTPVAGAVLYADNTATFWPAVHLEMNTAYRASVSTGAQSANGVPLEAEHSWQFTTGETVSPGLPVDLGTASRFVILSKSGISTVPASVVTGDIGVSPAAASYITGFSLSANPSNTFSTSPQVVGRVYASDYAPPTPSELTTAVGDMELAFTDAAARAPDVTELGAGNIGGMTLAPGVYKWGTGLLIPTDLSLDGGPTDVWIFQIAQDLTVSSAASVLLSGGASAHNVFWQVSGLVDIGTTAHMEGTIVTSTSLTLRTGASLNGRLLAQTAVDIDGAIVTAP